MIDFFVEMKWKLNGCGEFLLIFANVIFMVYLCKKKNIPHRDCSETGAISKYVSNKDLFFNEIYREKRYFFP